MLSLKINVVDSEVSFFAEFRACLSINRRKHILQSTFLPVLYYGDTIYQNVAATTFKPLDAFYHIILCFITGDRFKTHHCIRSAGPQSCRSLRYPLVCKALLQKLPAYLTSLLKCTEQKYKRNMQQFQRFY
jgi:hypothetical protein